MKRWKTFLVAAAMCAVAPDLVHGWASRQTFGAPPGGREALLVLGCPSNDDGTPDTMQRWRCEIARRTMNSQVECVVFSGTTARTGRSEAAVMAAHAKALGIPEEVIVLEEQARSTWENLAFTAPLIEEFDVVRIVSNPLHAWRARQMLAEQRPDLATRLAPADDYRVGERWFPKLHTLVYETVVRCRARQVCRTPL